MNNGGGVNGKGWCRIGYVMLTNEKDWLICSVCEWKKVGGGVNCWEREGVGEGKMIKGEKVWVI
jgi:hypothetical protein